MMSLGLYSNVWLGLIIIGTQVVEVLTRKFGVESLALTKTCPDTNFHVYWYYGYWVTCLQEEEEEEEEEKHGQNGKNIFGYNIHIWCSFAEIFGILFSFHMLSAIKLLKVESESTNWVFLMYGGNTNYHVNPYIQGTTVPCDILHTVNVYTGGKVYTLSQGTVVPCI